MVKVHLIGHGKWGAVIDNAINDLRYVKWTDSKDADWIILSMTAPHFPCPIK